jgi:diguanylate cyclase (GGDEF)-like protein/PAS domain S-box-containing protein
VDAAYSRWLQRAATTSVLIYCGLIAVFLPAFYFLLTPLPGVPPGSDSLTLRCGPAALSIVTAALVLLFPPIRRFSLALQFVNVSAAVVVIAMLVVNSGNHYAYIASGLLVIIGAQQAFYRSVHLALVFALGFLTHALYSAAHGVFLTPMNLAALATFGSGYVIGFIPAALRIKIQDSEIRNRLEAQRVKEELLAVQAITHLGNWSRDIVSGAVEWSRQLCSIFEIPAGTPARELVGLYERSVHPDDRAAFDARLAACEAAHEPVTLDHRVIARNGTVRWVELHGKYEFGETGDPVRWVGAVLDITARKEAEEALVFLARHDALTGLPNRTTVSDLLAGELGRAQQRGTQCAVVFLDLDRFKDINDTLGHTVGDHLLQELGGRIAAVLGATGVVGRWGGDEFVAIVPSVHDYADVEALAQSLIRAISEPLLINDIELAINASAGIAMYPRDGTEAGVLIRNADTAMYKAKQDLGCGYAFFSDELYAAASRRHYIQNELRRAITDGGLSLHYQPVVDAASGRIVAAEALVRWTDPSGRVRLPGEFIDIAEDSRIIVPLGAWVLNAACERAAIWQRDGFSIRLAVNVSPRQFEHSDFLDTLARTLTSTGADPALLEIEITEAAIMSSAEPVLATLQAIHRMGIRVAIDDFGTGYSSFAYLKRFAVDSLKIDRTFVEGIESEENFAIARSIVSVAHTLGLPVTAEGIETPAQAEIMADLGCDRLQGYHYGRPIPVEEFEALFSPHALMPESVTQHTVL